jgi:hypothetical protein
MGNLFEQKYPNNIRTITGLNNIPFQDDSIIECDTTLGAVSINLLDIPVSDGFGYWSTQYKLYIVDKSNNAGVNNITVNAPVGAKINGGSSFTISSNGASLLVRVASNTNYVGQYSVIAGGTGNGHIIADEGVNLPQKPILDFQGKGVIASDSVGKTVVTIDGAVNVKNTAYVSKNGSDTTGTIERLDLPFLTITKALDSIRLSYPDAVRNPKNRFKVVVEDGTYIEPQMGLYPYIDIDLGNSVVETFITDNIVGVTYSTNTEKDFTTKIFGNSRLLRHSTAITTYRVSNINSRILVQCDTISSDRDDAINVSGGYSRFICNKIFNNNTVNPFRQFSHAIELSQGDSGIAPFPPCTLDIVNAMIYMVGNDQACTVHFAVSEGDTVNTLNQTLNLYNCVVINDLGAISDNSKFSAIGVGITHPEQIGSTLNLYNTVLYSKNGQTIFVSNATAKANLTVYYYNLNNGNTDSLLVTPDANHTLIEYLKTVGFSIDPNVLPILP